MTEHSNDEWVLGRRRIVPEDATGPMVYAALAVDWCSEDEKGTVHNIWHAMLAAAPTLPSTDRIAALEAENKRLRGALRDLLTWFPEKPQPAEWRLKAGEYGADDAVIFARAALSASDNGKEGK